MKRARRAAPATMPEQVARFAGRHGITYPVVLGDDKSAGQTGAVDVFPASYLYDPSGRLRGSRQGVITQETVEAFITFRPVKKN